MKPDTAPDEVLLALDLTRLLAEKVVPGLPADRKNAADEFFGKLSSVSEDWLSLVATDPPAEPKKKREKKPCPSCPKEFLGKSGKLSRVGFRYLFDHNLVKAGDIAFLLKPESSKEFKSRGYPVLRQHVEGDESALFRHGERRYSAKAQLVCGGVRYLLTSQFYNNSVEPMLQWFSKHGLSRAKAKELVSAPERK